MLLLLIISTLLATLVSAEVEECPSSHDIYPCYCSRDEYLTSVNCEGFRDMALLKDILKNTVGKNVSFGFWKTHFGDIPSDLFKGHLSTNLHFENCKISSFGDKPFSGLEDSLSYLYIYGSVDKRRSDLKTFPLGHLKKLNFMSFEANDIHRLGNDWFQGGPATLKELMLEANDIHELGDKAFASLDNLREVWLGDNRVENVSRSIFAQPAKNLRLIEISFNKISSLPENFFDDMPALDTVNLSGNKLETIPENIWGKVWDQLDEVYMERNSGFTCDERLKWIYQRKKLPSIFTGNCSGGKFNGKELKDLKLTDFE